MNNQHDYGESLQPDIAPRFPFGCVILAAAIGWAVIAVAIGWAVS